MIYHGKYYTVGPTDFCGVACIVWSHGGGLPQWVNLQIVQQLQCRLISFYRLMLCKEDPLIHPFYHMHYHNMEANLKDRYILAITWWVSKVIQSYVSPHLAAVTGPRWKKLKQSYKWKPNSTAVKHHVPCTNDNLALEYRLEAMHSLNHWHYLQPIMNIS